MTAVLHDIVAEVPTIDSEGLEAFVLGDDDLDRLAASMCSCDAGSDNPY